MISPRLKFKNCAPPWMVINLPFLTRPSSPSSLTNAFSFVRMETFAGVPCENAWKVPSAFAFFFFPLEKNVWVNFPNSDGDELFFSVSDKTAV